ncbi:hypothetical protein HOV04_gp54 [Xanthomonas phage XcP1]|uniref:Uncharacterized protein n=1 Tax=Xanthomonas phage XcP1 TaxID=2785027 RepID=A0A3S7L8J3_9CAUD|nr:hypothetical protein HOV04_gp54 [Xanthomonas phage XcP1]AWN08556.1 hypothetical protein XcP1_054 [Xanthomonas phage XcP1]
MRMLTQTWATADSTELKDACEAGVLAILRGGAKPAPEMSPDFTDTARAAIAWVLWHHQGDSSAIGQPLRYALGMGDHEELSAKQISEAKRYAALVGARTDDFKQPAPAAVSVDLLRDAERYRRLKQKPQSWMLEYMKASRPLGKSLDEALDSTHTHPAATLEEEDILADRRRRVIESQRIRNSGRNGATKESES